MLAQRTQGLHSLWWTLAKVALTFSLELLGSHTHFLGEQQAQTSVKVPVLGPQSLTVLVALHGSVLLGAATVACRMLQDLHLQLQSSPAHQTCTAPMALHLGPHSFISGPGFGLPAAWIVLVPKGM